MANKVATKLIKKPGTAREIGATTGCTALIENPEKILSLIPNVISFYYTWMGTI